MAKVCSLTDTERPYNNNEPSSVCSLVAPHSQENPFGSKMSSIFNLGGKQTCLRLISQAAPVMGLLYFMSEWQQRHGWAPDGATFPVPGRGTGCETNRLFL